MSCVLTPPQGCFHLGQFEDDSHLSRLRTLVAHHPPGELLLPRGLSAAAAACLAATGARRELLRPGAEFWDSSRTLRVLAEREYFKGSEGAAVEWPPAVAALLEPSDTLGLTAAPGGELALSALGALTFYLSAAFLDQQLLSQRRFEPYRPLDQASEPAAAPTGPRGKLMVLDGATVTNLELLANSSGGQEAALVSLFAPVTAMGRRALGQWLLAPLLQPAAITARQAAVRELAAAGQQVDQLRLLLKKFPDLERLLSKVHPSSSSPLPPQVHAAGDRVKSKEHPDSRAIFFDSEKYNKRKIWDLLACLDGFRRCEEVVAALADLSAESRLLREVSQLEAAGGHFPDLRPVLDSFQAAFDQERARKEGRIAPKAGDVPELDEVCQICLKSFTNIYFRPGRA